MFFPLEEVPGEVWTRDRGSVTEPRGRRASAARGRKPSVLKGGVGGGGILMGPTRRSVTTSCRMASTPVQGRHVIEGDLAEVIVLPNPRA